MKDGGKNVDMNATYVALVSVCECARTFVCVSVLSVTFVSVSGCAQQCVSRGASVCYVYGACQSLSALASRVRARGETLTTSVILLTKWWQKISHGALMTAGVCQQALSPQQ